MKRSLLCLGVVLAVATSLADEDEWFRPLGLPPKAAPRRIAGGESFPPLPLPATPLRRSERKRQPSPSTLVGKVMWGETATFTYEGGLTTKISDWNLCPGDVQQLLAKAGRWFGLNYGHEPVHLGTFHADPERMPVLLFSGGRSLKLDRRQIETLRSYVLNGGMVIFDSIAGSPYFYASAKRVTEQAFPEFAVRVIPLDHPVFHILADVERVTYPKHLKSNIPFLEGIYVGCRIGVLISKYGLGCGWDDHEVPLIEKAIYYDIDSANKLGLNIIAYAVGYATVGREEAKPELFGALDEKRPSDELVLAQIQHEGAWNVHPGGVATLLRRLRQNTALRVSLKRVPVVPGRDDLAPYPILYLTGLDEFQFDEKAVAALRRFLANAGTLIINNGLGLRTFDTAVRRELKKVLPEVDLVPVPASHPLFSSVFPVTEVQYTPAVLREKPDLRQCYLEGITLNGDLRVIYSPIDIEAAWQGCEHPLAKAYEPYSGVQLGINMIMYAMTH
ncbi:MAG: DUF4159 domain-containing protein [Kiritimatiellia bacterium]